MIVLSTDTCADAERIRNAVEDAVIAICPASELTTADSETDCVIIGCQSPFFQERIDVLKEMERQLPLVPVILVTDRQTGLARFRLEGPEGSGAGDAEASGRRREPGVLERGAGCVAGGGRAAVLEPQDDGRTGPAAEKGAGRGQGDGCARRRTRSRGPRPGRRATRSPTAMGTRSPRRWRC